MVSASNASILAASGIGSLMGRVGHAPRRFSRIHPDFGTPFWSVATATGTIVALIVAFIGVFPAEEALLGITLGLTALTGFATLNLLVPLSLVNVALVVSRRRFPDMDRPLQVPLVPFLPAIGIVANLTLITNLPFRGVVVGVGVVTTLLGAYLVWGGMPKIEDMFEEVVVPPTANGQGAGDERYRVLVPVARPDRAVRHVRLAEAIATARAGEPLIQVLNVTEIPEQTPAELVEEEARRNTAVIEKELVQADLDVEYFVEGHICRNIGFDILHTAREDDADLIVMGYPEEHREITEAVEYDAPCDVVFASGFSESIDMDVVNVGVGGGPHHLAALPLVNALAAAGSDIHLVNVQAPGELEEDPGKTLKRLADTETATVHNVTSTNIADGLVSTAAENGGFLLVGASRTRKLRQWVFGSTPDRVVEQAAEAGVPVVVFASSVGISGWFQDRLFPIYRYARKRIGPNRQSSPVGSGRKTD
jgi:nucleotide-binding universal stress UspA family protein